MRQLDPEIKLSGKWDGSVKNKPGYSWGSDAKINLIRCGKKRKWLAVYYYQGGRGEILKIFKPRSTVEYYDMIQQLTMWNYGTCKLCPIVRAEIDATS